ncbi:hypothetical protein JKF63_03725 [Porcisia hertigi]|uniref:Uncharacterized protein n=1 Tax=Porcisia hertigi TaxID=2761500 RepID=A0A836L6Z0_9TRYP|nr:hypothetical protein JKF63_03725 [Porcisia hertigi]
MSLTHNSALTMQVPPLQSEKASSADSLADIIQQVYTQQYIEARHQYKASHARFSGRVKRPPPSFLERYCRDALHDLSFYTSASNAEEACPPLECTHGPRRIGLHSVNYELRRLAQQRMLDAHASMKPTADNIAALLVAQEAAEYADLLTLEAASFMDVARVYYNNVLGVSCNVEWLEKKARQDFEDEHNHATMVLLAQLREELWLAQQRLFLRALGLCPEALPHVAQLRLMATEADALRMSEVPSLDSREALPLWHRVCAIRSETESEEDISFRRMVLACVVQAHTLQGGYLRYDTVSGHLRRTYRETPSYMKDAIEYALQFETFAVIVEEEAQRMRIIEEVEEAYDVLAAEVTFDVDGDESSSSPIAGITTSAT